MGRDWYMAQLIEYTRGVAVGLHDPRLWQIANALEIALLQGEDIRFKAATAAGWKRKPDGGV